MKVLNDDLVNTILTIGGEEIVMEMRDMARRMRRAARLATFALVSAAITSWAITAAAIKYLFFQ